jgi:succinate dehydrogenase/fumarate reductase flavoprotein subunit
MRGGSTVGGGSPLSRAVDFLQKHMANGAGPLRTGRKLSLTYANLRQVESIIGMCPPPEPFKPFDMERLEWFDLRNMVLVASAVVKAAMARTESRGAHQREDFPEMLPQWQVHQTVRLVGDRLHISGAPQPAEAVPS